MKYLILCLLACGWKKPVEKPSLVNISKTKDGLICQQIDMNADGLTDIWNYYRKRENASPILKRKEIDLNNDEVYDIQTHFNDAGLITTEIKDTDFDGFYERTDHYQGNRKVLTTIDSNKDKIPDIRLIYEGGRVKRKEQDTNFDKNNRIDYWQLLSENGEVIKWGRDLNDDGLIDVRGE